MPPGIMKRSSSKRKASEGSDEHEFSEEQSLVAGRQTRKAALKSHRVWDTLKPGAAKHAEMEEEMSNESPGPGTSAKRTRVILKRTSKGAQDDGDQSDKQDEKLEDEKHIEMQSKKEPERVIIAPRKIIPTKVLHSQPQPAMNKEQLALIEQEMEKHDQFDESEHDEFSDEDEEHDQKDRPTRFVLDDPNDEDFDISMRGRRGGFRGGDSFANRGRGRGVTQIQQQPQRTGIIPIFSTTSFPRGNIQRGRPRGRAMTAMGGGIMRGRINIRQPVNYFASPQSRQLTNGIYSLQSGSGGGSIGGGGGDVSVPRSTTQQQPPVVRVLRPMSMSSNFQTLRPSSMSVGGGTTQSQQFAETNFNVNREMENYRGRIVAGTSVQEFNDIIDHMLGEYQRIVDDRSRLITCHREYVSHLKQTNQAALEIKDNKIRQLELSVEQLQQKVMVGVKQEQLRLVKVGTVPGNENQDCGGTTTQQSQQHEQHSAPPQIHRIELVRNQQDGDDDEKPELQHMGESEVQIGEDDPSSDGGGQQQQTYWPSTGQQQQQRIRILGIGGGGNTVDRGIPQLHPNAPYFDDEMDDDDEEFDDEEDSAEMDDELGAQVTI